ncbi:SH3 domain-containing protein [Streptomyces collinus]|uniref:SH3 domain-containing protein n=1 Tax=Streptomyces collinus TaxID=42684 RepID=UPI00332A51A2
MSGPWPWPWPLLGARAVARRGRAGERGDGPACTHQVKLDTRVAATVNFRNGPGTGYTSLGLLNKGQGVYWACYKGNWGYLKPYYGAHKGHWGWVSRTYIDVPMQTD